MDKNRFQGKFIVLDGPDGCGKSTQAQLLANWIESSGCEVVRFRDPGTTKIGEAIRKILLDKEYAGMGDNVEVLLYMAARAQLWKEKIKPALTMNKCVIMDRWLSSTCAYQGKAGNFGLEKVIKIAQDCLERSWPDLTILFDLELATSSNRILRELDRMESKGDLYHRMVREGYIEFANLFKENIENKNFKLEIVDASKDIETVKESVIDIIENWV